MSKTGVISHRRKKHQSGLFTNSRSLVVTGVLGLSLSVFFLLIISVWGPLIPPDGHLFKPFSFDAALGLFVINLGAFIQIANFTDRGRVLWKRWMIFAVLGAYSIESIQPLRGVDPRFARDHVLADILIGAIGMTFFSILIMIMTLIFALKIYTSKSARKLLLYSLRWSISIIFVGFATGIVMMLAILSANYHGQYSMYIWLYGHGFAFHSLQAFPLIALLLERKTLEHGKKLINFVGIIWITMILLLDIQTYLGQTLLQGPLFVTNAVLLVIYLCVLFYAAKSFKRSFSESTSGHDLAS